MDSPDRWCRRLRDSGPCVVKNKPYGSPNGLLCMAPKDRDLVLTASFGHDRGHVTSPTGFGRVKVVSTLGTGRPKRHFLTTQGPESRS